MPLSGCSSGWVLTAVVTILLLPSPLYITDVFSGSEDLPEILLPSDTVQSDLPTNFASHKFPPVDLIATFVLLSLGFFMYVFEWIQRKIMERRLTKLNQYLSTNLAKLRNWDAHQEQLEMTLKMVQNAISEYNLLLYLLLRQHNCLPNIHKGPPSDCFFSKEPEDLNFLPNPTIDV